MGALALLGSATFFNSTACSSSPDNGNTAGVSGYGGVVATGGVTGIATGGASAGGTTQAPAGGSGNTVTQGTGNTTALGGSGNAVGSGGITGTGAITGTGGIIGAGGITSAGGASAGGTSGDTGGTTSTGGASGSTGMGGSAGGTAIMEGTPPCISSASEVAIIGDSYVTGAASPALQPALGMLDATANSFRNYAVPGTSLATGGITGLIPPQLTTALMQTTKAIIMDGGGNDILICDAAMFPGCATTCTSKGSAMNMQCQTIVQKATDEAKALMIQDSMSGVHDVIYFFYPHIPDAGPGGAGFTEILDYSEPLAKQLCDSASSLTSGKTFCHFVDLVQPFMAAGGDKNPANFAADGIHPSQAGQNIIAKEIFNVMKTNCIGMTAADAMKNGCTCSTM
ncbi:MAG TPA: SGNH/GDSL hydrolase family protein [Polyangiaceae bacterium]|nr:SGNH/GDSL hydrolase family protein [Polyangiaceae bacterium]